MENTALVALSPSDLAPAQSALSGFCVEKQQELNEELRDLNEHMLIAKANGWKLRGLQSSISRTERRILYYDKIKAAVEAGYLVVPNFPVSVMAVRVDRSRQPEKTTDSHWITFQAQPQLLPAGKGRYVDNLVVKEDQSYEIEKDGKTVQKTHYVSGDYDEPDFPYQVVKPVVLDATQRAMALKVFDTIGIVQNTTMRADPIMVGQILDPRGNDKHITFFIAWWLNTSDL